MKMIYIANIRIPTTKAHGIQIVKMCEFFASMGVDVELVVAKRRNPVKENIFKFYGIKENFKIRRVGSINLLRFRAIGKFAVILQAFTFALSVFLLVLFKYRDKENIFYFRDEFSPWLLSMLNKNIFLEVHVFDKRFKYYKIFFPKLNGLILVTAIAKKEFINLGINKDKILLAPDGVDLGKFDIKIGKKEAREKLKLPQDKKIIGYTGSFKTMGMDKGINDILKSLSLLNDNIIFIAVGGSDKDIDHYKKQAKNLNIDGRIKLIGHVQQSELAIYQKACDVLLMPFPRTDHYSYYMSPLKMFEYMAGKRPIITTDLPAIREVLNEANAIITKPDNPESLANGIKKTLVGKSFAEKIAEQAFRDVKKYAWDKRINNIVEFINKNKR